MKDETGDGENDKLQDIKLWGVFLFGLIGATASRIAIFAQIIVKLIFHAVLLNSLQLSRSQSSWKGGSGSSFRSAFQEEAWKRYNKRLREEYEEEMERVERIKHMQSVFSRERNKYKRSYEQWRENGPGAYHQHFQRDDWYWKADASFRDQRTNYRDIPRESAYYSLSHHYSVLGLDRFRTTPYTDAEIKVAFRMKAKQYHPDQNQDNREAAEAKFKEVMCSYEAIQKERKNQNL
ncbi:uncharacterized protein LOC107495856 isoform X1 [Arachis duranensis]|uniref:Uncharacterized protein LOC107495856 isoform X1 n=1 Tax=Arachis duranensis TaxID=130453 RepID=A0A6P5MEG7_ARADU|nr:uncharacterized protein LOC107495856 isoform X1 [Arachis duranensis]XP_025606796.1 uncharacterized protein LOC112697713 isoform X2 [Arachis hypogaea]